MDFSEMSKRVAQVHVRGVARMASTPSLQEGAFITVAACADVPVSVPCGGKPHSNGRVVPSVESLVRKYVVALHPLHLIEGWQLGKVKLGDREEHLPECYTEV